MEYPPLQPFTMDNEEISHLSLEQQVEALMFLMEGNLADEYQRALEIIPERVRSEAKVSDFLRAENNNPNQAAIRLAKYWKTRKWLFGDRWLLPMNQVREKRKTKTKSMTTHTNHCISTIIPLIDATDRCRHINTRGGRVTEVGVHHNCR